MKIVKDFVLPTVVLTVICLIVSFALVFTNSITEPIITERLNAEATAARIELLPEADTFTPVENLENPPEGFVDCYVAKNGAGYVITTKAFGYGGEITVMTGIKSDSTISKVKVLNHGETTGIGTRVVDDENYLSTYNGKTGSLEGVTGVAGATVSSKGLRSAVTAAFEVYSAVSGADVPEAENPIEPEKPETPPVDFMAQLFPDVPKGDIIESASEEYTAFKAGDQGFVILSSQEGFYSKPLTLAVGFDPNGSIVGIIVTEMNETDGVGSGVGDAAYLEKYVGKTSAVDVDGVENVAGATISSTAFKDAVKAAVELFDTVKNDMQSAIAPFITKIYSDATAEEVTNAEVDGFAAYKVGSKGYIVLGSAEGFYSKPLTLAVGFDANGSITGIAVTEMNETEGVGSGVGDAAYLEKYVGKTSAADVDGVENVAGATISSTAFKDALKDAIERFSQAKGVLGA